MQTTAHRARTLAILVGGHGRRMGGVAKGLLTAREGDETLVERTRRIGMLARFERFVLVGPPARLLPYARLSFEALTDREDIDGPLAGLSALCAHERSPFVLVGCDMPSLDHAVLDRLADGSATHAIIAPRDQDTRRWQPLLAWYSPARVAPALDEAISDGARSFQRAFSLMDCVEFVLSDQERACLEDWDAPEDVTARSR